VVAVAVAVIQVTEELVVLAAEEPVVVQQTELEPLGRQTPGAVGAVGAVDLPPEATEGLVGLVL
jgi:hypothetical protein